MWSCLCGRAQRQTRHSPVTYALFSHDDEADYNEEEEDDEEHPQVTGRLERARLRARRRYKRQLEEKEKNFVAQGPEREIEILRLQSKIKSTRRWLRRTEDVVLQTKRVAGSLGSLQSSSSPPGAGLTSMEVLYDVPSLSSLPMLSGGVDQVLPLVTPTCNAHLQPDSWRMVSGCRSVS